MILARRLLVHHACAVVCRRNTTLIVRVGTRMREFRGGVGRGRTGGVFGAGSLRELHRSIRADDERQPGDQATKAAASQYGVRVQIALGLNQRRVYLNDFAMRVLRDRTGTCPMRCASCAWACRP